MFHLKPSIFPPHYKTYIFTGAYMQLQHAQADNRCSGSPRVFSQRWQPTMCAKPRHTCNNSNPQFITPQVSTMCYYLTHLTTCFSSAKSIYIYISMVICLHKQLHLTPEAVDSFPVQCLLRAADLIIRTPPLHWLPILPHLLIQLCSLSSCLVSLGPIMKVCLNFRFLGMLRQSNLVRSSSSTFDHT